MSEDRVLKMGEKIKTLRQKAGVAVEDLAAILDIPAAVLSKIENGVFKPTVATLLKLSQYFDVALESFFSDEVLDKPLQVVRAEEHEKADRPRASGERAASYRYESLAPALKDKRMQPFLIELDPGVQENLKPLSHEGEEFLYVTEGEIEFHADQEKIILHPGDSLYFHSHIPHALFGKGPGKSRAVVVVYQERQVVRK